MRMADRVLSWLARRIATAVPTLFVLLTLTFFLIRLAPGGPFDREQALPAAVQANLEARFALDRPLPMQYLIWLGRVAQGDLGPSFQYRDTDVVTLIAQGFPVSLTLGGLALLVALVGGLALGLLAARRAGSRLDRMLMLLATVGLAVPGFVLAPLFVLLFAVRLGWLPAGGLGDFDAAHLLLPVVALALPPLAVVARLARASLVDVLASDYIRTARARGVGERRLLLRHALRPAVLPVLSYLGPAAAGLLTGSVVVEQVFGLPGLGRYFVQGALNRDYTLVMGCVLVYGTLVIGFNLLVDVAHALLDPRLRDPVPAS